MAGEKLDYMHYNPLQPHWQLSKDPVDYRFSPARFTKQGKMIRCNRKGKIFHNLFTQQPPLRGTRLKITLPSRSTYSPDTMG